MNEDCYFWIKENKEDEQIMNIMCAQCHDDKYSNIGWFWEGSKKGYGPYEYKCDICGKIIHAAPTT